jgi:8-oxo-dGTP diphosphatase
MSYTHRISGRGVVIHDDKILLNMFGDGAYYNIPGGGVEQGESIRESVVREIFEESGLTIEVSEFLFFLECESPYDIQNGKEIGQASLVFSCRLIGSDHIKSPTIPDTNPDDPSMTSHAVWILINELSQINLIPKINENLIKYHATGVFEPKHIEEAKIAN